VLAALAWHILPAVASPIPPTAEGLWDALFRPRYGELLTQPPYPGDHLPHGISPNCAPTETESRSSIYHGICDKQPGIRECRAAATRRDCPLVAQCARNIVLCIELRLALMFDCFAGGDEGQGVSRYLCNFFSQRHPLAEQDHELIECRFPVP
jgi:hypothetical protein